MATAGYLAYRRRHQDADTVLDPSKAAYYADALKILDEPRVERKLPNGRQLMAALAVRVYYASFATEERVITRWQLQQELANGADESLHVPEYRLQDALGFLQKEHLIGRRSQASNPRSQGYYALPALEWGMTDNDKLPILSEAEVAFRGGLPDQR